MLGTAEKETAKSDEIWKSTAVTALRTQQETDFGLWGPYEFEMPKKEGKWDNVTTNSPKILANKILGLLASSWLQLFIDVDEAEKKPNKAGRNRISDTERLANGCIWVADREAISVPSGKTIQSALSTYATVRGGTAKSVYWYTDEKLKKPVCDIRSYDPTYCQWIEGEKEPLWFCYRNYVTKYFIEHTYEKQLNDGFSYGSPDTYGRILLYTFWDTEQWKVAINGQYIDDHRHGLGYIPVNVRSCGSAPYMQSEKYQDTMKESWQSCFSTIRDTAPMESQLLSIAFSKAKESGKIKGVAKYDSTLSGGQVPEEIKKLGYGGEGRNEMVFLDIAKGQDFIQTVEPPSNQQVMEMYDVLRAMNMLATIDRIAYGQMARSGSGVLAAQLTENALDFMKPFRECVQEDFKWIAEECVRQFKNGDFAKISVEGRDSKREKFYVDLEPGDVEEKHFDCELVDDRLRDELQELGAAIQKVTYGLSSRRTAMVKHNIVEDPDKELEIMEEEKHKEMAATDPVMHNKELANWYKDQGNEEMALYHLTLAQIAIQATIEGMMGGATPQEEEKKPPVISPQMQSAKMATEPQK